MTIRTVSRRLVAADRDEDQHFPRLIADRGAVGVHPQLEGTEYATRPGVENPALGRPSMGCPRPPAVVSCDDLARGGALGVPPPPTSRTTSRATWFGMRKRQNYYS